MQPSDNPFKWAIELINSSQKFTGGTTPSRKVKRKETFFDLQFYNKVMVKKIYKLYLRGKTTSEISDWMIINTTHCLDYDLINHIIDRMNEITL